ncbi:hypothetical protein [Streptomyces sp. NBC_00454]|uniref:hypothetical protein n=1 Tax=Streptomyces sp. NBC_00454 TaxID=2975747 RepID=UPI0030E31B3D
MSTRAGFALIAVAFIIAGGGFAGIVTYLFNRDASTSAGATGNTEAVNKGVLAASTTVLILIAILTFFVMAGGLEKA